MLAFNLHLPTITHDWQWDPHHGRWINPAGTGWIQPFDNPALESTLIHDPGAVLVVARERRAYATPLPQPGPTHPGGVEALLAAMQRWDGEYLTVQLRPGHIRLHAGAYGTAPIYLTLDSGQRAYGSWDLADLRPHLRTDRLCDRVAARALTRQPGYTADTLFRGVHRLTERARATITTSGVTVTYPPPTLHVLKPRQLRPDADPIAALEDLLASVVARLPVPTRLVGVHLSGGADSANVALTVAAVHPNPVSYGLLVGGEAGCYQERRRQALVSRLGLRDVTVHAPDYPPFLPGGARSRPHPVVGEYYLEAFDAAARRATDATGMRVVFTGIGGDELVALPPHERPTPLPALQLPPWLGARTLAALDQTHANLAPVAPVHLPTLLGLAVHTPLLLRRGLWPVSPLADPTLIRLGESLPVAWRRGKRLLRQRLQRAGLPAHVTHPPAHQQETFTALMQHGLRRHGLALVQRMLDSSSVLIDTGYIDPAGLRAAYEDAQAATAVPTLLADTIALEVGLRSLT